MIDQTAVFTTTTSTPHAQADAEFISVLTHQTAAK
jgi:hypothetical protein